MLLKQVVTQIRSAETDEPDRQAIQINNLRGWLAPERREQPWIAQELVYRLLKYVNGVAVLLETENAQYTPGVESAKVVRYALRVE